MKTGVAVGAAALAVVLGGTSSRAATPSRIVFAADRAPAVTGEIYRLDANGHRVDLSKSPYQDIAPSVSPDGKHVAFFSDRGGKGHAYEVGIDGRGLRTIGPSLSALVGECDPRAAWQPHGARLVLNACSSRSASLWIAGAHGKTVAVRGGGVLTLQPWSPDGRVFLAFLDHGSTGITRALSSTGRKLFDVPDTTYPGSAWSANGLLAVKTRGGGAVYDESGRLRFTYRGAGQAVSAWSPDGSKLAVDTGKALLVLTSSGQTVLHESLAAYGAVWSGNRKVVVGGFGRCGCNSKSVDVFTGRLSPASDRWFDTLSSDGKLAVVTSPRSHGVTFTIGAGPPSGGRARTYGAVLGCRQYGAREPAIGWQQFAGRSIVYESWGYCDPPYANLYSVEPNGQNAVSVTDVQAQETQPAVSPDGAEIAFVWAKLTGISCAGCSDGIRVVTQNGDPLGTLTNPPSCTFDDSPSWSPDGTTILYSEETCSDAGKLFTIPAGGGTPRDLGILGNEPAWGPARIAYVGSDPSDRGLWTANPDGSDRVQVAAHGSNPAWSATGELAYLVGRTLVVGSSSSTLPFARVASLAWTPDGTRLVVAAAKKNAPSLDVYTVNPDGTSPVRLTTSYGVIDADG
jgi:Tol biopolymer transport system component